jgi:hypothetical protein
MILGMVGIAVSLMSMLLAALTAKHSVRRDTIRDLAHRIDTLEGELAECQHKHRAAEERNLLLMEHLVRMQIGSAD